MKLAYIDSCIWIMDAVHVAIAGHYGCERFVTTDPHFHSLTAIVPVLIALPDGQ